MALELFKLEKLKITAYEKIERSDKGESFTVMFNPNSISMKHENKLNKRQGINATGRKAEYIYSYSNVLNLDLVLDGTGVTDYGVSTLLGMGTKSVAEQIEQLLKLCFLMEGEIHEPKFLKIQWGEGELADFDCRMQSVDIQYSLFDTNGKPLHATLKAVFVDDTPPEKRTRRAGKKSPDLVRTRTVKSGDTLPLLAKGIYGSSEYYLRLAQLNNIDDFRNLTPGQQIIFPPLAKKKQ